MWGELNGERCGGCRDLGPHQYNAACQFGNHEEQDAGDHKSQGPQVTGTFEGVVGPGLMLTLPVPPEVVAVLRMPIPLDALQWLVTDLKRTYGNSLVIRTDTGIEGWLVVATSESQDSGASS